MGMKKGKFKKKEKDPRLSVSSRHDVVDEDEMDDEIDAFHKNRDFVSLDLNENMEDSEDDDELPVLDFKDYHDEVDEGDDGDRGLAAKIVRTQKYLKAKFGGVDDEIVEDADEEDHEKVVWGSKKDMYGADVDYEIQSSDDEDAAEEEAEVLKLQSEKAKFLTMEDFGLENPSEDEDDREPTFEEMDNGKSLPKSIKDEDEMTCSIIKKDLNALTKEEQMDLVCSSAPELIGLLSELNDALEELENKASTDSEKYRSSIKGTMHFMEVKELLLMSYCQAIVFYLLLKSEGQPVRDHPVVSQLVEIKSLLEKMKEMEKSSSFDSEEMLQSDLNNVAVQNLDEEKANDFLSNNQIPSRASAEESTVELEDALVHTLNSKSKETNQEEKIDLESMKMLKIRASLEEKLRQKGVFGSILPGKKRIGEPLQPVNRNLETIDDFVDEALEDGKSAIKSHSNGSLLRAIPQSNKRKAISGDDDIPQRDDIAERRRKHEQRVLASTAGIAPEDGGAKTDDMSADDDTNGESGSDSDLEYYHQMEEQHAAKKHATKSTEHLRAGEVVASSLPDTVDGKRQITHQMEKNRGLTRHRKKLTKNPRKKYKLKHKKAEIRRKGQVREIRKPTGSYGGEASGINAAVSRSVRFKH